MPREKTPKAPALSDLVEGIHVVRAFKPGDIVFIQCAKALRVEAMQHIHAEFKRLLPDLKIVVLQDGLTVAGRQEDQAPRYMGSEVLAAILLERRRQIEREGFDAAHDDEHGNGEMIAAAACYCVSAQEQLTNIPTEDFERFTLADFWPWTPEWWKPKSARRDLIRAAALIVAELERMERAGIE